MKSPIEKEIRRTEKKEKKQLSKRSVRLPMKDKLYSKVPDKLREKLEAAFIKAFELVFLKGTGVIEKTFDKEQSALRYEAHDYMVDKAQSKKSIRNLDQSAKKHNILNHLATTLTGTGMGLIGLGLPDIPLMVSTMLKGIYEIALGYGFSYDSKEEKIYILCLIRTALSDKEQKKDANWDLHHLDRQQADLHVEVRKTASVLADALLVEKFVQGIPIVGMIGGYVNHAVYDKTTALASVSYKKRYLKQKLQGR